MPLAPLLIRLRNWNRSRITRRRHARISALADSSRQERFEFIFKTNFWNTAESRSGGGSTLASTEVLRPQLERLLEELRIDTFLDASCGDFNWMQHLRLPRGTRYIGADIVAPMVEDLQRRFGSETRSFRQLDLVSGPLPYADLWMCRDTMFHLSNADVLETLAGFARSDIRWGLFTTMPQVDVNVDIVSGNFRPIDLMGAPFHLPRPHRRIDDHPRGEAPRHLGLWSREEVAAALSRGR